MITGNRPSNYQLLQVQIVINLIQNIDFFL